MFYYGSIVQLYFFSVSEVNLRPLFSLASFFKLWHLYKCRFDDTKIEGQGEFKICLCGIGVIKKGRDLKGIYFIKNK